MTESEIFKQHVEAYRARVADIDFKAVQPILGLTQTGDEFLLPFFGRNYHLSKVGLCDDSGAEPTYGVSVILSQYLILCPDAVHEDRRWTAFRDFKKASAFVNVNYFTSDTERVLTTTFSGKLEALDKACRKMGGVPSDEDLSYDLVMEFKALPRISLLLLFNEGDEDFPAYGTVFFQRQAEHYLDPESLAMTSAYLAKNLKKLAVAS